MSTLRGFMLKNIAIASSVCFSFFTQAESIVGCYSKTEVINSAVSAYSEQTTSFINVSKVDNRYFAKGTILGGNFHVCNLGSPDEGSDGPLALTQEGDKLTFQSVDSEYNIDCKLEISISNGLLQIKDDNFHCSKYIFSCGVHASLQGIELHKSNTACPSQNGNISG